MSKVDKTDNVTIASEAAAGNADALRLQISHVLDVGGGAWMGPKAITVMAPSHTIKSEDPPAEAASAPAAETASAAKQP